MPSTHRSRAALFASAAALGLCTTPAHAQTAPPTTDPASPAATPEQADGSDIVVTGSRIARPDYEAPNPIVSFDAAAVQQSGNTNVTNFLQRVPALTGSLDSTQTAGYDAVARSQFGGVGLNALNLRNLGTNRTLVLVNGRRHVAGEVNTAAVDINSIPTDLIERVDVLTGTASAVYGADGVSGVVNFVLKRDFDGLSARTQMGVSQRGDAANRFASIIAGKNFAGGAGNIALAYEYSAEDPLRYEDRTYLGQYRRGFIVTNPNDPDDDPTIPDNLPATDLRYAGESPYGAIDLGSRNVDTDGDGTPDAFGPDYTNEFRGDGRPYDFGQLLGGYTFGGDSTPAAGFVGDLLPKIERHAVNLLTHYDVSDAFKLSIEGKFVQARATTFQQPTGNYPAVLSIDNPYMPASIRDAAIANGSSVVYSTRDNFDLGRRGESDRRRTYRGVIDLTGRLSDHATYDIYYTYGRTDVRITNINDRLSDRYLAALDVVTGPNGQPTCRSNIDPAAAAGAVTFTPGANSGCRPINTFGDYTIDPAARGFFQIDHSSNARVTQSVANASISGDFGELFSLPGGPVQFAVGGEYRRETSRFRPNDFLTGNLFYQFDEPGGVQPVSGKFDVVEAFGEINVPILRRVPFAETLSVGAAGRYSDYSTIGGTKTWQVNGIYAPVRDISVRGSYGKAVRAPNIGELFTPGAATQNFISDPCDLAFLNNGTQFRSANCQTLLTGLGVNPATYAPITGDAQGTGDGNAFGQIRGNPDLDAETARTWTAGVVLRPRFLQNFTLSADWYDIRLKGAVSTPQAQTIAELCVDQPTLDNVYCQALTREQGTGRVRNFVVQPQNVSQFRTAGLDLNASYVVRTARAGTLDLRLVGGYLNKLDIVQTPGAQVEDQVDQPGRPKWNFTFSPTWTLEGLTLSYNLRWFDRTRRFAKNVTAGDPDYAPRNLLRYKELWQHDVQLQYAVTDDFSFYGGVNNLTDQKPDVDATDQPISSLGRFLYVGARVAFAGKD